MVKPAHWTYTSIDNPNGDLRQGDILQPSEALRDLLGEVHPHFNDDKYVAFLVLSQTCDLVRRDRNPCKSRYINLGVVRLLRDFLLPLLDRVCEKVRIKGRPVVGFYLDETKYKAVQLLKKIFNQNAQAEGLFYLHPDAGVGIAKPSVALLQVSVAVRAHEHYETLVKARSGRLKEPFPSQLGWLIGNLFSRVATEDFPASDRNELVAGFLGENTDLGQGNPLWISSKKAMAATQAGLDITGMSKAEIAAALEKHRPAAPKEVAMERVVASVREVITDASEDHIQTLRTKLASDSVFESACRS